MAVNVADLRAYSPSQLLTLSKERGIENIGRARRDDIIFACLKQAAKNGEEIFAQGVLELGSDGYGFARAHEASYQPGPADIYVSPKMVRKYNLRTGDTVYGKVRPPRDGGERYFAMSSFEKINYEDPTQSRQKIDFENLTALFPNDRLRLERGNNTTEDITSRIIDLAAPIGKGQRGLIVSPPKAGKTVMMQNVAHAITANHPECKLIVLLIDERPEEVTDMRRSVKGEVVASTFDEPPARHVQVAEMVISKAKRLVEHKHDVVILLDSITRLARAYNSVAPSSGKVLSGGVEANALQRPKRFFGAARNVEEGGSLTILATALVDTGSKMDEVIYEEFKGTGNMEIHLSRNIAQKRIYPAIHVKSSGTRREDLLMSEEELRRAWILRRYLGSMEDHAATEFLIDRLKKSKTNEQFFESMKGE